MSGRCWSVDAHSKRGFAYDLSTSDAMPDLFRDAVSLAIAPTHWNWNDLTVRYIYTTLFAAKSHSMIQINNK